VLNCYHLKEGCTCGNSWLFTVLWVWFYDLHYIWSFEVWLSQRVKWSIQYHLAFGKVFELSYLRKAWALRLSLGFSNLRPSPSHLKAMYKAQFCLAFWGLALLAWLCWLGSLRPSFAHYCQCPIVN